MRDGSLKRTRCTAIIPKSQKKGEGRIYQSKPIEWTVSSVTGRPKLLSASINHFTAFIKCVIYKPGGPFCCWGHKSIEVRKVYFRIALTRC